MRRGPRAGVRARAGAGRPAPAADGRRAARRLRRSRGRHDLGGLRLDDREDHRVGAGQGRGPGPAPPCPRPDRRRHRGRRDEPLFPADAPGPPGAALRRRRQPLARPADRGGRARAEPRAGGAAGGCGRGVRGRPRRGGERVPRGRAAGAPGDAGQRRHHGAAAVRGRRPRPGRVPDRAQLLPGPLGPRGRRPLGRGGERVRTPRAVRRAAAPRDRREAGPAVPDPCRRDDAPGGARRRRRRPGRVAGLRRVRPRAARRHGGRGRPGGRAREHEDGVDGHRALRGRGRRGRRRPQRPGERRGADPAAPCHRAAADGEHRRRSGRPDGPGGANAGGHATVRAGLRLAAHLPPGVRPRPGDAQAAARGAAAPRRDQPSRRPGPAALRGRAARPVRRGGSALPAAHRDAARRHADGQQHAGVPARVPAVDGPRPGRAAGGVPDAARGGPRALRRPGAGEDPRAGVGRRLDVPVVQPGGPAGARRAVDPGTPAAGGLRAAPAGRRRDARAAGPPDHLGAGPPPGRRRPRPRRQVPLLRRARCSKGWSAPSTRRPSAAWTTSRPTRAARAAPGSSIAWCAPRSRSVGPCCAAGSGPRTTACAARCSRCTRAATTGSGSCATCTSTRRAANCCA